MVINRGEIHRSFLGNLPQRRAGKALLAKQSFGGIEDSFACGLRFQGHKQAIETKVLNSQVKSQIPVDTGLTAWICDLGFDRADRCTCRIAETDAARSLAGRGDSGSDGRK